MISVNENSQFIRLLIFKIHRWVAKSRRKIKTKPNVTMMKHISSRFAMLIMQKLGRYINLIFAINIEKKKLESMKKKLK